MNIDNLIKELKERKEGYLRFYEKYDDVKTQGIAFGLDEAIQVVKRFNKQ